jgi:ATP-dependent DNA helicase PIF1
MTQEEALAIMKSGKNVFLTGEPGSGKTHTVNQYVAWLREHGVEPAVTASTGIAATHIGGMTIHSWCGIGVRDSLTKHDLKQIVGNKRVTARVKDAHVLVIDEISMLAGKTLNAVNLACRTIRENNMPFGGLQMILVGDFFQLPPIIRRELAEGLSQEMLIPSDDDEPPTPFAFSSLAWAELEPFVCYLSEQHRQEDAIFLELLSAVRGGTVSEKHHGLLHTRRGVADFGEATKLFSHNVDVDRMNGIALERLPGELREFPMLSHGAKDIVAALKRGCLSPELLALKIGARVMFTKNDPNRRFVNGTTGVVVGFENEDGYPIIETTGRRTIIVEPTEWTVENEGKILARVAQFPLRLAWAITVHKSQGMSLDAAHMDLSSAFEYGQGYVALSRVRTLAGLSLAGFNRRALEVHPDIRAKDAEFRRESQAAQEELARTAPDELREMQDTFLEHCGGKIEKIEKKVRDSYDDSPGYIKKPRAPRWTRTLELVLANETLEEMADDQGRVPSTILSHLEELLILEKITLDDLAHLRHGKEDAILKAHEAFKTLTPEHLKPVYEQLKGKISYDTLHLARLFYR